MHHIELGPWNHAADLEMFKLLKYNTFYLSFWFLYIQYLYQAVYWANQEFCFSEADFLIWSIYINN